MRVLFVKKFSLIFPQIKFYVFLMLVTNNAVWFEQDGDLTKAITFTYLQTHKK